MDKIKFTILLNDTLKGHMVTLNKRDKRRLREKFEFLEAGIWDSGVRVKKLRGASGKVIFEARLSKGDRILFTLGKHKAGIAIYIWGIVKHDDVSKTVHKIFPDNAPFLSFEPEIIEDYPEVLIDEFPKEYFSQESIEEKSPDDYGPQKWLILSDEEWERMFLSQNSDNFEIFLFLTSEQANVLEIDPPLLLSGTAGSGKTTISVYYLLRKDFLNKKRLFLTYNPYLKEFSERIYSGLISCTELDSSGIKPDFYVFRDLLYDFAKSSGFHCNKKNEVGLREFQHIFRNHKFHQKYDAELVWEEIRSIIKGAKPPISLERYRKLLQAYIQNELGQNDLFELKDYLLGLKRLEVIDKIGRIMERKTRYSRFDDFVQAITHGNDPKEDEHKYILGEVLKIIEKKAKSFTAPLLTYQEYLNLGKKRAPNFLFERKDIYTIAEYYQDKLEEQGKWDEIDLCRHAIQHLDKQANRFRYDLVVCDEVQDFTDIQISLIFRLAKSYKGIVFTGDPKQIINPSGFRWEEAKNKFYERGVEVPDVYHFNLNFRCVGNIVRLSNALLDLKQQLIGLSGSELKEDWKFNGRPPFLLTGMSEKDLLDRLHLTGASQIILVRNKNDQRKLKKALNTELVFTINEAKGLEFDTVFLWKFSSDKKSAAIWRRIKDGNHFDQRHYPHIKHEINLLFVAITRARNTLIIFDSTNDVWDLAIFHNLFYRTGERDILSEIWQRVSTPEEWDKQGDYFFKREHYPAAVECYKNAGNITRAEIAKAFSFEEEKQFKAAAELYEKHGYIQEAAECYEDASLFVHALRLWEKLKNKNRVMISRIKLYEQNGDFNKAAEEWSKLKEFEKAFENWNKAGNNQKIAEYYFSKKRYNKAAEAFEKAHNYDSAALCYNKARQFEKAADLFYKAGNIHKALVLYKRLKIKSKLLSCYIELEDYYNAALLYERDEAIDKAIGCFRDFAEISQENRKVLLEEAIKYFPKRSKLKSAIRYSALSMYDKSAPIFFENKYYNIALDEFKAISDHEGAAECYLKLNNHYEAALEYEKCDGEDKTDKVTKIFEEYIDLYGGYNKRRADNLFKAAESFFNEGLFDKAIVRYKAISDVDRIYETYLKMDKNEEALNYFLEFDMAEYGIKYLDTKKDLAVSPDFIDTLVSRYHEARERFLDDEEYLDIILKLFKILLKKDKNQEILSQINLFLSSFHKYFVYEDLPKSFTDLALEVKHYNTIFEFLKSRTYRDTKSEFLDSFIKNIKQKAEKEQDDNLLACYFFMHDKHKYENILKDTDVKECNYKLFTESKRHYHKVVNYLNNKSEIEQAARVCRRYNNFRLAAEIYEGSGDFGSAGKHYREAKVYEDSIRCYKRIGDEKGIARVYERMNKFDEAVSIWKKLGKTKEVNRVLKKKTKELGAKKQLNLF